MREGVQSEETRRIASEDWAAWLCSRPLVPPYPMVPGPSLERRCSGGQRSQPLVMDPATWGLVLVKIIIICSYLINNDMYVADCPLVPARCTRTGARWGPDTSVALVSAQIVLSVSVRDRKHGNTSCGKSSDHLLLVLTCPHISTHFYCNTEAGDCEWRWLPLVPTISHVCSVCNVTRLLHILSQYWHPPRVPSLPTHAHTCLLNILTNGDTCHVSQCGVQLCQGCKVAA